MQQTNITNGAQTKTSTGAVATTTGLDISGLAGDYRFEVEVTDLHSSDGTPTANVVIEDTVDAFTGAVPVAEFSFTGPITSDAPVKVSGHVAGLRIGVSSAKVRANLVELGGSSPSVTLRAGLWN